MSHGIDPSRAAALAASLRRAAAGVRLAGGSRAASRRLAADLEAEAADIDDRIRRLGSGPSRRRSAPAPAAGQRRRRAGGAAGGAGAGRRAGVAVRAARRYLGVPYRWGGTSRRGVDCSGLVVLAFRAAGIRLPRTSRQQARAGRAVPSLGAARPGDLLFFGRPVRHVAIYLGGGRMIEAPRTGLRVRVVAVRRPAAVRRVTVR